jgi:hypothetical protein
MVEGLLGGGSVLKMLVFYYALLASKRMQLAILAKNVLIQTGFPLIQ